MTERYFEKFPIIQYNGQAAIDITRKATILNSVYSNPFLYYQADLHEGQRADNLASNYYDDPYMSWIVYYSNRIVDPYYQWYMDQTTFNNFIIDKYGSLANATNKIKFYRNNWYNNIDPISVNNFNNLSPQSLQEFYSPYYGDDSSSTPLSYYRKQEDWIINTNAIAGYGINNTSNNFINDEIVNVVFDNNNIGKGQVNFANSSYVSLQHLSGITVTGTISATSYLYGTESQVNTRMISVTSIANNIPLNESLYWSPVYYYDYENEINRNNQSVKLLQSSYSTSISNQLETVINQ
jgi:hypothetical protein